jgi:hypothetical protein
LYNIFNRNKQHQKCQYPSQQCQAHFQLCCRHYSSLSRPPIFMILTSQT